MTIFGKPQGCGVGLRTEHYETITRDWPAMDWFEAISENYMDSGGRPLRILEEVRKHYPVALHGVSLSIGSIDPLNKNYLERLKKLAERIDPFLISDHLCWSGVEGYQLHDLMPLPFTEESLNHVVQRVQQVQEYLGRAMLIENVSSYVTYKHSVIAEWDFLSEVSRRSGCGILLDLNNIFVNARNHGFDPVRYLEGIPPEKVAQFHLAGHTDMGDFLFDTHSGEVIDPVWDLYRKALELYGPVSTLIEWDDAIPEFARLSREAEKARAWYLQAKTPLNLSGNKEKIEAAKVFSKSSDKGLPLEAVQKMIRERMLPGSSEVKTSTDIFLNPQGKAKGDFRMGIYEQGYGIRLYEGLKEAYETIRQLLGDARFKKLTEVYVRRYPSREYNLSFTGRHLAEFLKENPMSEEWPFLEDLARLEWFITEAFHSFDERPGDLSGLTGVALEEWENARFMFQPSLRMAEFSWPVLDLWRSRKNLREPGVLPLEKGVQKVVIYRADLKVRAEAVTPLEFQCMKMLHEGKKLGEVCESLAENHPEENPPLMEWFSKWASGGVITEIRFSEIRKNAAL